MKLGLGLPHLGTLATPDAIRTVAVAAEAAGLDSVWAMDRLLSPVVPRTLGYPGSADGRLPAAQQRVFDPLVALTVAAAVTDRIRIGTDVLVAHWYPPVLLARSLATLDQVSAGRLTVGLGMGWSVDEFEAVGESMSERGRRLEEILDVLELLWADGTSEIRTTREHVAPSVIDLTPVQVPRPPILLAASNPIGLDRIARRADGWLPFGVPLDDIGPMWRTIREMADDHGRDPDGLQLVVRADPTLTDIRLGSDRGSFTGTRRQVIGDIDRTRELGATELIIDLQANTCCPDDLVATALDLVDEHLLAVAA